MGQSSISIDDMGQTETATEIVEPEEFVKIEKPLPFIKIVLRETEDIVLFECNSITVPKESEEAKAVEDDNALYEYLTLGKGKNRRTSDAEAQTGNVLFKSRSVNTERIKNQNVGTFVSNYDMFDTYKDLAIHTESLDSLDKQAKIEVTTYTKHGGDDVDKLLSSSDNFKLSSMVIQRLLAGNIFHDRQKRFRNMIMPDPLDLSIKYLYRLNVLWTYKMIETIGKAVSCFSWCHTNGDLLAIGYGIYDFASFSDRLAGGFVCIWSIKVFVFFIFRFIRFY